MQATFLKRLLQSVKNTIIYSVSNEILLHNVQVRRVADTSENCLGSDRIAYGFTMSIFHMFLTPKADEHQRLQEDAQDTTSDSPLFKHNIELI